MKKIIKLTETELNRIIKKVITEQTDRTGNLDNPEDFLPKPNVPTKLGVKNPSVAPSINTNKLTPAPNTTTAPVKSPAKPEYSQPSMLVTGGVKKGDSGPKVIELQKKLQQMGYGSVKPDGLFGPVTQTAVLSFQSSHNLKTDGIAGPKTLGMLDAAIKTKQLTNPLPGIMNSPAKTFGVLKSDTNPPANPLKTNKPITTTPSGLKSNPNMF